MIFSINQTFQRILASIAQGGGGWSSAPPKFALDQKRTLRSLQRPPGGGTDPVGNHGSKSCADHVLGPHAKEADAETESVEENSKEAQGHILIPELDEAAKRGAIC
jgi:hypothetical protein